MSLINQALRKAQRDRTPNRMSQPGEQSPAAMASSAASGMNPALVIGLVIAVAVLIGLVVGLSVVLLKGDPEPQLAASPAIANTETSTPAAPVVPKAPTTQAEPIQTQAAPISPAAPAPTTLPQTPPAPSVVDELRKAREAAEAQALAEAKAAEEAAARAAAKPSEDIISWLGKAKISGVKISETASKVILNGKPYAVGEYVNFPLGLQVMLIQEKRILFVDKNGKKYMKRL